MLDYPLVVFAGCLVLMWLATKAGAYIHARGRHLEEQERQDLHSVLTAALTLLGLIIGFTFSMAVTRFDLRKDAEAKEANAIGTEYLRAGLLPAPDASRVRELLRPYLDQRIEFFRTRNARKLQRIQGSVAELESDLWCAVAASAAVDRSPLAALAVSGMNEVLDLQGFTQALFWNRIPLAAWLLMVTIAMACSFLSGYTAQRTQARVKLFFVLPLILSVSFFLIADLDSPHGGVIRVHPENLESLSRSLPMR